MDLSYYYRKITSYARTLPDFVIVGAQKAGTTSLFNYLVQHPQVFNTKFKEIHFFNRRLGEPISNYKHYFPTTLSKFINRGNLAGEASPDYLYFPEVAYSIKETMPLTKIIILLREPVSRAFSHYNHNRRMKREGLSFADAIKYEGIRIQENYFDLKTSNKSLQQDYAHYSYKRKGVYYNQVKPYLDLFPREQLLIQQSEKLFRQPQEVFASTLQFLGLREFKPDKFQVWNEGKSNKTQADPYSETIRYLKEYYKPHNEKLFELIGETYNWDED